MARPAKQQPPAPAAAPPTATDDNARADEDTDASASTMTTKKRRKRRKALTEEEDIAILRAVLAIRPHHAAHGQGRRLWQDAADRVIMEVGGEMTTTLCKGRYDNLLKRFVQEQEAGGFWPLDATRRELVMAALEDQRLLGEKGTREGSQNAKLKRRMVELAVAATDRAVGDNPAPWIADRSKTSMAPATAKTQSIKTSSPSGSVPSASTTAASALAAMASTPPRPLPSTAQPLPLASTTTAARSITGTPASTTPVSRPATSTPLSTTPSPKSAGPSSSSNVVGKPTATASAVTPSKTSGVAVVPRSLGPTLSATTTKPTTASAPVTSRVVNDVAAFNQRFPPGTPFRTRTAARTPGMVPFTNVIATANQQVNQRIADTYHQISRSVITPHRYGPGRPPSASAVPPLGPLLPTTSTAQTYSANGTPSKPTTANAAANQPNAPTTLASTVSTSTSASVARSTTTALTTRSPATAPVSTPAKPTTLQKVARSPQLNGAAASPPAQPAPSVSARATVGISGPAIRANAMNAVNATARASSSHSAPTSTLIAARTTTTTSSGSSAVPSTSSVRNSSPASVASQATTSRPVIPAARNDVAGPTILKPRQTSAAASALSTPPTCAPGLSTQVSASLATSRTQVTPTGPSVTSSTPASRSLGTNLSTNSPSGIAGRTASAPTERRAFVESALSTMLERLTDMERAWLEDRDRDRELQSRAVASGPGYNSSSGARTVSHEDFQELVRKMEASQQEQAELKQQVASLSSALKTSEHERSQLNDQVALLAAMAEEAQHERAELKHNVASLASLLKDVTGQAGTLRQLEDAQRRQADELRRYQQEEEARRRVTQIDHRAQLEMLEQRLDQLEQNVPDLDDPSRPSHDRPLISAVEQAVADETPSANATSDMRTTTLGKRTRTFNPFAELQATLEKQHELIQLYEEALASHSSHSHTELELAELRTAIEVERTDRTREYVALLDSIKHVVTNDEAP